MKNIYVYIVVVFLALWVLYPSKQEKQTEKNDNRVWTQMSSQDSIAFNSVLAKSSQIKEKIEKAKEITILFAENPPGSPNYLVALKKVAEIVGYSGPLDRDALIRYMQGTREFLCSYEGDLLVVSSIVELMQVSNIPICFISCPMTKEMGQSQMGSRGIVMINVFQVMEMYDALTEYLDNRYHISQESWIFAIIAQEIYHAQRANTGGGTDLESDYVSIDIAGRFYVAMRLLDISHYFYDGVQERSELSMSAGYIQQHRKYYSCAKAGDLSQLGTFQDWERILKNNSCDWNRLNQRECYIANMTNIGIAFLMRLRDFDPNLIERTYECMLHSR